MAHNHPWAARVGLVLASASPARAKLLLAAGIEPQVLPTEVDEEAILSTGRSSATSRHEELTPAEEVNLLAQAKARAALATGRISPTSQQLLVLGCDSMLSFRGQMLGKPHDPQVAVNRIRELQGQDAVLWTGHHLILLELEPDRGSYRTVQEVTGSASTTVHFGSISEAEIQAYVATGEPLEVAGSFTIDGLGGPFIRGVTGDPHAVVGLSLPLLRDLATELGIFWPDLWTTGSSN